MNIIIENNSDEPIYSQIYNQIKNQIISGVLNEDDMLMFLKMVLLSQKEQVKNY